MERNSSHNCRLRLLCGLVMCLLISAPFALADPVGVAQKRRACNGWPCKPPIFIMPCIEHVFALRRQILPQIIRFGGGFD